VSSLVNGYTIMSANVSSQRYTTMVMTGIPSGGMSLRQPVERAAYGTGDFISVLIARNSSMSSSTIPGQAIIPNL